MPTRIIRTETDRDMAATWLQNMKPPFQVAVTSGSIRSLEQNALSHKWYQEVAHQREDMTVNEVRAECKLIFGVPILREENEKFRETYDRILKPLSYEEKINFIETTELPITRIMTVGQLSKYLDRMSDHFMKQGLVLTIPEAA